MTSQRDAASGIINLLASVLPIIAKCTPALDPETTQLVDKDIQFSYIRLQARCFLVAEELSRVKNLLDPTREDIQVLLANLESMLTPTDSVSNTHLSVPHSYARLIALRDESLHLQHLPSKQKHRILTKWLDYTSQHRNDRIGRVLQSFHDDCQDRYVEGAYTLPVEPPSPPQRREPPFGVSDAAESVFGSLLAAKPCTCHPNRHYGARLCLATHRKPEEIASKFSFDLFITPDETWQQVQITLRERQAMTLKLNDHPSTTLDDNSNVAVKEVTALCKPIAAMRNWRWRSHRLMFAVESGKLWSLKPEEQRDPIDYIGDPISLEDFIAHRQTPFTDMTKRIVAVLLAYTILHLLGTRWIQPQWGPSNVVFLPITSTIPIKPYVQVSLADDCATCTLQQAEESIDDFFDDDDLDQHPFPHLVMLAIMLMQVYLARTFRSFAVEFQVDNPDSISANEKYALASQIFQKYSRVISYSEKYWAAIESCLDPYIGKSVDDTDLDTYTLRRVMYEKIIGPLEDELVQGRFSSDDLILNLDVKASNLDLANWGQEIRLQAQHQSMQTTLPMRQLAKRHQWNPVIPQHSACITPIRAGAGKYTRAAHRGKLLSSTSPASWHSTWRSGFFDDQILPKDTEQGICRNAYREWKDKTLQVYEEFLSPDTKGEPIKVALLDTGLDLQHPDFIFDVGRQRRVRGHKNFIRTATGSENRDVSDQNGHGTHTAGLLLDFSPEADVYIAKIAEHDPHDCQVVAEAIRYTVDIWRVDIISMSFGYTTRDNGYILIEEAIDYAQSKGVLLFAAASNSGANQRRTFPARHDNVICIHSTAADGVPSRFNPPPDCNDNFATIGEAVESAWPSELCDKEVNDCCVAWKSGTSYATPIAAGIAAFLLQYAAENLDEADVRLLKRPRGLRAVFREISLGSQGYDYVAPTVHPGHLFGRDKDYVRQRISVILNES